MNKKHKKLLQIFLGLVLLLVLFVVGKNYLPLGKILYRKPTPEKEFVNQQQIQTQAPNSLHFDFEVAPKAATPSGFYKDIAHSGHFSAKVFGKNSYSFSMERKVSEIGSGNLKAVSISAWVYIFPTKSEVTSCLVFSMTNELGVNLTWKGVDVSGKDLPMGKWFKISRMFDLADISVKPDYKIQFYYWNNSNTDILVDDFYIVFGRAPERKGDSSLVDMTTRQPFVSKFNYPPFPFFLAEKEETGNHNSAWLLDDGKRKEGLVSPYDRLVTGKFTGNNTGLDEFLVMHPDKKSELFLFCHDKHEFSRVGINAAPEIQSFFDAPLIFAGNFSGRGNSELIFIREKEILLAGFDRLPDPCSDKSEKEITLKVIQKGTTSFPTADLAKMQFLSLDADGDRMTELLAVGPDSKWWLLKYTAAGWKTNADEKGNSIPEWNSQKEKSALFAGKFSLRFDRDLILTVSEDKKNHSSRYSLRRFDASKGQFVPLFNREKDHFGKIVGMDSLKVSDLFFTGNFGGNGTFLRYNRDWRFDLKMLSFNDTTYRILGNVDFHGYEKDRNPKYFEILKIIPGDFFTRGKTSLLVIGRNCKKQDPVTGKCLEFEERTMLPGTIQVYSFSPSAKK
jgi:hypothetical protein